MNYWLFKSEPGCYSWQDQVRDRVTSWSGVRNYQANNNMKAMALGDLVFFYHSVHEKRIMGIVRVAQEFHPDPTDETHRFGMVDVEYVQELKHPVTLADIKADPCLNHLPLVYQSRLSVMPIDKPSWNLICHRGGVDG